VLGIHPDWVEAAAFAWLAQRAINQLPGNLPSVTGATEEVISGGIYWA
jgi:anhydro-N-acetylmuramic acid kinase